MKLKINNVKGYSPGQLVTVQTDGDGIPLDKFWRRRIKDAKIDNCVEAVSPAKPKKERS